MTLTNFENLNSILERFDGPSNYLYLFKSNRQTFSRQGNVRHSTSKLLKCDLVQTLNTFRNPSLRIFDAGKTSLVTIKPITYICQFFINFFKEDAKVTA